ncbi:MAG TPA: site-specific DNA-methyltransferase [Isosphaeraceae bacterium]|jgi:DNA modification methylase|nr:site-specific DNA-methyltransferase [Isosphaeraceae bacterium]
MQHGLNGTANDPLAEVRQGDAYDLFGTLEAASVDLVITSPPYWGLRAYGQKHNWNIWDEWKKENDKHATPSYEWYREHGGCLGLEPLADWYSSFIAEIMHKAWKVLKLRGSMWLNIGDTYFARWSSIRDKGRQGLGNNKRERRKTPMGGYRQEKQLLLIPSRTAIKLQEKGWILRNDLIWYKPNVPPRPEKDRLPLTHEHFFHFVKKPTEGRAAYHYDMDEVGETGHDVVKQNVQAGTKGHSATFPRDLIRPRIRSSCPEGGLVLDPFCGTGTALAVAVEQNRRALGFEISAEYVAVSRKATTGIARGLF